MSMNPNIGSIDRLLRLLAGVVLLALAFVPGLQVFGSGAATWIAAIVGLVLVGTAAVRICPLYSLMGVYTGARR